MVGGVSGDLDPGMVIASDRRSDPSRLFFNKFRSPDQIWSQLRRSTTKLLAKALVLS